MNPDTLPAARFRAFVWSLGLAVLTATAQTTTPAKPADKTDAAQPAEEEKKAADDGTLEKSVDSTKLIKLERYQVLGTRIRRTESEGPSPVSTYDTEFIRSTGALTLADFMNYLPQNYTGIGAGRSSAPNELNPEFGQRTETTTPAANFVTGASAASPGQTGVSGVSLRGLGSGSTLVLVDGRRAAQSGTGNRSSDSRQGFVDLNSIPLGMVERIDVITDGASAIYGADAVAGVVNIILKKNWVGNELNGTFKGAEHGGGRERSVTLTSGFSKGKLRGTVSVSYYDRADLKASQRSFSKNQDHRGIVAGYNADGSPIAGRDLRLLWGYPAVVQAQGGTVAGNFDAIPGIRVVLVPPGATTTPSVSQFIPTTAIIAPASVTNASGQVRDNTSAYNDLVPASERYGVAGNFTYSVNDRLDIYGSANFTDNRSYYETQPGVSSASATSGFGNFSTLVPAAMNPFNQNVIVGMVHYEFGSVWQKVHTKSAGGLIGARGLIGKTWNWDSAVNYQQNQTAQITRSFNGAAITAALNNADATQRLNPFIDARAAGINQTAIYEKMAIYPTLDSEGRLLTADFSANGELIDIWGGPVLMAFGATYSKFENENVAVNYTTAVTPVVSTSEVEGSDSSKAGFAELSVPVIGKPNAFTGVRQFDLSLAVRYEDYSQAGDSTVPKYGFTWVPIKSVLLRGSYSESFRAPSLTEYQVANSTITSTLLDPLRTPASTTGIATFRGQNANIKPETSHTEVLGLIFEPPFAKGLSLSVDYYTTIQKNVIQTLSGQTIVNNAALFSDRITRAAPDTTDTALGQPGRITAVDITFVNFGKIQNESVDFGLDYLIPWQELGRWRVIVSATHTIKSTRELGPGLPPVVDEGDTFAPPAWRYNASLFWSKGPWNASAFYTFIDSFATNRAGNTLTSTYPVASADKIDVRGGYEFKNGVWRGYGKGLRVMGGIGNIMDKEPPFSDTIFGYNGGLHGAWALGRSYELSFVLPF
jgi:outer membrane receptor protein involved in Fe transport